MKQLRWREEELNYLLQLAQQHPLPALARRMKARALIAGWPPRSKQAIKNCLCRHNERARPRSNSNLATTHSAAEILQVSRNRVAGWLRNPAIWEILAPQVRDRIRYIDRRGWRRLAQQRPEVLGGIPADRLFLLLEDRELADQIAAAYPCSLSDSRVRCVETGQVWASCKEAGAALNVHRSTITKAIRADQPVPVLGLRFERLQLQGKG